MSSIFFKYICYHILYHLLFLSKKQYYYKKKYHIIKSIIKNYNKENIYFFGIKLFSILKLNNISCYYFLQIPLITITSSEFKYIIKIFGLIEIYKKKVIKKQYKDVVKNEEININDMSYSEQKIYMILKIFHKGEVHENRH